MLQRRQLPVGHEADQNRNGILGWQVHVVERDAEHLQSSHANSGLFREEAFEQMLEDLLGQTYALTIDPSYQANTPEEESNEEIPRTMWLAALSRVLKKSSGSASSFVSAVPEAEERVALCCFCNRRTT